MTSLEDARWQAYGAPHPATLAARRAAGGMLAGLSLLLGRLAQRLAAPSGRPVAGDMEVEFYAEAGAPEGALYVDGQLVGWIVGVARL